VRAAIAAARADAGPDGLVCVAGSLALVGDARTALGLRPSERWW
jgi:folylpolyglutamate synthase/dihydropteroate synthase